MLGARSERLVRSGRAGARRRRRGRAAAGEQGRQAPTRTIRRSIAEVRQLVVARNERRLRQGLEELDVDAEVARTLEELDP